MPGGGSKSLEVESLHESIFFNVYIRKLRLQTWRSVQHISATLKNYKRPRPPCTTQTPYTEAKIALQSSMTHQRPRPPRTSQTPYTTDLISANLI